MRISDWSSDVCSSDLFLFNTLNSLSTLVLKGSKSEAETMIMNLSSFLRSSLAVDPEQLVSLDEEIALQRLYLDIEQTRFPDRLQVEVAMPDELKNACVPRSEEHTSELQSLMRISYAVFC